MMNMLFQLLIKADGYEMKDVEPQKLIETIHKVLQGERIIHPQAKSVIKAVSKTALYE